MRKLFLVNTEWRKFDMHLIYEIVSAKFFLLSACLCHTRTHTPHKSKEFLLLTFNIALVRVRWKEKIASVSADFSSHQVLNPSRIVFLEMDEFSVFNICGSWDVRGLSKVCLVTCVSSGNWELKQIEACVREKNCDIWKRRPLIQSNLTFRMTDNLSVPW